MFTNVSTHKKAKNLFFPDEAQAQDDTDGVVFVLPSVHWSMCSGPNESHLPSLYLWISWSRHRSQSRIHNTRTTTYIFRTEMGSIRFLCCHSFILWYYWSILHCLSLSVYQWCIYSFTCIIYILSPHMTHKVKQGSMTLQRMTNKALITIASICDVHILYEAVHIANNYQSGPLSFAIFLDSNYQNVDLEVCNISPFLRLLPKTI